MGVNRSRLSSHTCSLEDRHPILGREYDLSDYTSGLYSVQNGSASHNNSQVYCSYKAQLLDSGGHHVTSGKLELTYSNLIYRFLQDKNLRTVQWPLDGLRGYGCYCNLFTFEAGRRSGRPGIFVFKCKQARVLHAALSNHLHSLAKSPPTADLDCACRPISIQQKQPIQRLSLEHLADAMSEPCCISDENDRLMSISTVGDTSIPLQRSFVQLRPRPLPSATPPDTLENRSHFSDEYIYLSRSIPTSRQLAADFAVSRTPPPLDAGSSSLLPSGGGGVYLVAVPGPASAHSYENQRSLLVGSS